MRSLVSFTTSRFRSRQARTQRAAVAASSGARCGSRLSHSVVTQAGNTAPNSCAMSPPPRSTSGVSSRAACARNRGSRRSMRARWRVRSRALLYGVWAGAS
ncbi:hypothetical protein ACWDA3_53880 [Nonomuraea rubra]